MEPPTIVPHNNRTKSAATVRNDIDRRDGVHFSTIGDCAPYSLPSDCKGIAFVTISYPHQRNEADGLPQEPPLQPVAKNESNA